MDKRWWAVWVLAVFFVLAGVWHFRQTASGSVIKVPQYPGTPDAEEIAERLSGRDILKEQGIQVQRVNQLGGVPWFQPLLSGEYDVTGFAWVGWLNVAARGGKIQAVYSSSAVTKDALGRSGLLVKADGPIHSIQDLKGKSIAVNVLGFAAEYVIKLMLEKNGLSLDQVQLVQVPVEQEEQALRTGQVDAAAGTTSTGTWIDLALARGGLRILPGSSEFEVVGGNHTPIGSGFREDFIQAHPDLVRRYVAAEREIEQVIWDEFKKDPHHVRAIYAEISKEKGGNPELGNYFWPQDPQELVVKDEDIQFWIDVLTKEGKLTPGQVKVSDVYTDQFDPLAGGRKN